MQHCKRRYKRITHKCKRIAYDVSMNTEKAIELAGTREKLAKLLGVASISTYRWKPDLPKMREFQLQALRPKWFKDKK